MYIPQYYEFSCPANIVAGHDALERIADLLAAMDARSPMILTDTGVMDAGLVDIVMAALGSRLTIAAVESDVPPDSDVELVGRLAGVYRDKGCDSIIAVGGGSVLDTAKGINILVSENADSLFEFTGAGRLNRPLNPLIAVPTTAGTGSEVTQAAVIADRANNRKMLFTSHVIVPTAAIVDSRMTLTLPPHITAATAMDAMAHAVEAKVMLGANPISSAHADTAITLVSRYLPDVLDTPDDKDKRLALATAATMAGMAFSNSMVGMVHALGHSTGAVCHVPHGTCMAIFLPYGLEYNLHKVEDRIAELLFYLAGPDTFAATAPHDRAQAAIDWIRRFNRTLNRATGGRHALSLKDLITPDGTPMVPWEALGKIAETALEDGAIFYNPEEMDFDDFLMVAQAAWAGVPLTR